MNITSSSLQKNNSLVSKKITVTLSHFGEKGAYANQSIKKGEIVCIFSGHIFDKNTYDVLPRDLKHYAMGIGEDLFLGALSTDEIDDGDYINHSCEPNLGIVGKNVLVAMKNIKQGEELSFDYAMCDTQNEDIYCLCNKSLCRKVITGNDWKISTLQKRYGMFFSEYILKKINQSKRDKIHIATATQDYFY